MFRTRSTFRRAGGAHRVGGFALVEALVALAILGAIVALAHSTFGAGWRAKNWLRGEVSAVAIARAQLAAAGIVTPLREGSTSGAVDGHDWQVAIVPYEGIEYRGKGPRLAAWWITVEVTAPGTTTTAPRQVRLSTLKLAEPSQ